MPVNEEMMKRLQKMHGKKRGEEIYYAMENKKKHKNSMDKDKDD